MQFAKQIIQWYETERRELPWRATKDPYLIWLSEVILQQTRVEQGMDYYQRFIVKFPDVSTLATAPEEEVLKLWQGLGYYSRARNMLHAARHMVEFCDGQIPASYKDLIKLKGIGDYTAAAIASIAYNEAVAVVDGNVKRVISRIYGLYNTGTSLYKSVKEIMQLEMDTQRPGDFNQAVMEFGALQCTPRNPQCELCIFKDHCRAFANKMTEKLPVREVKKKPELKYLNYLVIKIDAKEPGYIFNKRSTDGIWKNLYDFPLVESDKQISPQQLILHHFKRWLDDDFQIQIPDKAYKHQLTHRSLQARFYIVSVDRADAVIMNPGWVFISNDKVGNLPIPRLIDRFISDHEELFP